jgi:hypothetical protein
MARVAKGHKVFLFVSASSLDRLSVMHKLGWLAAQLAVRMGCSVLLPCLDPFRPVAWALADMRALGLLCSTLFVVFVAFGKECRKALITVSAPMVGEPWASWSLARPGWFVGHTSSRRTAP